MTAIIFLCLFWLLPIYLCEQIASERSRNQYKGAFVGFCTGWFGVVCLWLGLKTRAKDNPRLLY